MQISRYDVNMRGVRHLAAMALIACGVHHATSAQAQWGASFTPSASAPAGVEECPHALTWSPIDPAATDTFQMQFETRTLSSLTDHGIELIHGTDSDPNSVISGTPTVSGDIVTFVLAPDTGCATAGCREGNWYSVHAQPTDSASNKPVGRVCLHVERRRFGKPTQ